MMFGQQSMALSKIWIMSANGARFRNSKSYVVNVVDFTKSLSAWRMEGNFAFLALEAQTATSLRCFWGLRKFSGAASITVPLVPQPFGVGRE